MEGKCFIVLKIEGVILVFWSFEFL